MSNCGSAGGRLEKYCLFQKEVENGMRTDGTLKPFALVPQGACRRCEGALSRWFGGAVQDGQRRNPAAKPANLGVVDLQEEGVRHHR